MQYFTITVAMIALRIFGGGRGGQSQNTKKCPHRQKKGLHKEKNALHMVKKHSYGEKRPSHGKNVPHRRNNAPHRDNFVHGGGRALTRDPPPPPAAVLDCGLHYNILSRRYLTKIT